VKNINGNIVVEDVWLGKNNLDIPFNDWILNTYYIGTNIPSDQWKLDEAMKSYKGWAVPNGWTPEIGKNVADQARSMIQNGAKFYEFGNKNWFNWGYSCVGFVESVYEKNGIDPITKEKLFLTPAAQYRQLTCKDNFYEDLFSMLLDLPFLQGSIDEITKSPTSSKPIDLVNSMTPEDKFGPSGYDEPNTSVNERFISGEESIYYRIDFWNRENATAPACDVYVYDDLATNVDRSSFRFREIGFMNWTVPLEPSQYFNINVDTRPEMNLIVNVEGVYYSETGRINITYRSLDPATFETPDDPMAGFLPPITISGHEIGWISFTVDPDSGVATGTIIQNQAHVNFDGVGPFNPAPKEGPYTNTIDSGKPISQMTAQLINNTEIKVFITGSDDLGGSGVRDYTIYMSDNGGAYLPVLNNLDSLTASISGTPVHTYRFYSNARDNVGNRENQKTSPDCTITVPDFPTLIANFTSNVTSGKTPVSVQFNDTSSGGPTAWYWEFGDGGDSTVRNATHVYNSAGTFTVNLTVTNATVTDVESKTGYITVTKGVLPLPR
jgi:hypothetical protein